MTFYSDFLYSQDFSNVTVLPVTHSLGTDQLQVRFINLDDGQSIIFSDVVYGSDSKNEFTVFFSNPSTGQVEITAAEYFEPRFIPVEKIEEVKNFDFQNSGGSSVQLNLTSSYVTIGDDSSDLPNSKRALQGNGINISLFGQNGVRFSVNPSIVALQNQNNVFTEENEFSEVVFFQKGLSGSLTSLVDGSPYLVDGDNMSVLVQPNGSIRLDAIVEKFEWIEEEFSPQNIVGNSVMSQQLLHEPINPSAVLMYVNGILQRQDATVGTYTLSGGSNQNVNWFGNNASGFPLDANDCIVFKYQRSIGN